MVRLKLIFSLSNTLLRRKIEMLLLAVTEVRLGHCSLDKESFLTQVLETKLNNKQRLCVLCN